MGGLRKTDIKYKFTATNNTARNFGATMLDREKFQENRENELK